MLTLTQFGKFALMSGAALALVACESSGSYRLASVGTVPDGSSGGGTASSSGGDGSGGSSSGGSGSSSGGTASGGGSSSSGGTGTLGAPILVTAGNAVIGVAGKHDQLATLVNGKVPAATPVTATVTRVLTKTGQTLVNLGNGNSLILNKAGGKVGDIIKIDLGSRTVIGAPSGSPLLGVGVLAPPGSGNLVTLTSGAAPGSGTTGGVLNTVTAPVSAVVGGAVGGSVTTPVTTVTGGATGGAGVTTGVTNTVGGVLNGLKKKK